MYLNYCLQPQVRFDLQVDLKEYIFSFLKYCTVFCPFYGFYLNLNFLRIQEISRFQFLDFLPSPTTIFHD